MENLLWSNFSTNSILDGSGKMNNDPECPEFKQLICLETLLSNRRIPDLDFRMLVLLRTRANLRERTELETLRKTRRLSPGEARRLIDLRLIQDYGDASLLSEARRPDALDKWMETKKTL
jgi:hypothetical protein